MAIKTLADIQTQLSTGGSSGKIVEQDLIKDIVDSFTHADDLATDIADFVTDAELTTALADYSTTAETTTILADYTLSADLLQAAQADSVAADTAAMVVDFNLLLAKLRLAGIITP